MIQEGISSELCCITINCLC